MSVLSIGELLDLGGSASTAGLIPYSALEYNSNNEISGISGSAIAGGGGGVDSATVSSIASSYAESAVSGVVSTVSSNSASWGSFDSATVSSIASSYAESAVSSYVPYSSFEYSAGTTLITAVSGSAIAGQNFNPSQMRLVIDSATMSAGSSESGIEIGVKSGVFQPTGAYATGVSVVVVSDSAQATASDVVYVVTGV